MKCYIHDTKKSLVTEDVFDQQSQWEILKYETTNFSTCYSKDNCRGKKRKAAHVRK